MARKKVSVETGKYLTSLILGSLLTEETLQDMEYKSHTEGLCPTDVNVLLAELRNTRHALTNPLYLYGGARISRHALLAREATIREKDEIINRLHKQVEEWASRCAKAESELIELKQPYPADAITEKVN